MDYQKLERFVNLGYSLSRIQEEQLRTEEGCRHVFRLGTDFALHYLNPPVPERTVLDFLANKQPVVQPIPQLSIAPGELVECSPGDFIGVVTEDAPVNKGVIFRVVAFDPPDVSSVYVREVPLVSEKLYRQMLDIVKAAKC